MISFLLLAVATARGGRHRAHGRDNGDGNLPYFVASKVYEPADFPDTIEEELPKTEAEQFQEQKVRQAKKEHIERMVSEEVSKILGEMGFTSELGRQLVLAKRLSVILDVFITGAEVELRRRRRIRA